jgi:hypothetical protein
VIFIIIFFFFLRKMGFHQANKSTDITASCYHKKFCPFWEELPNPQPKVNLIPRRLHLNMSIFRYCTIFPNIFFFFLFVFHLDSISAKSTSTTNNRSITYAYTIIWNIGKMLIQQIFFSFIILQWRRIYLIDVKLMFNQLPMYNSIKWIEIRPDRFLCAWHLIVHVGNICI